MQSDQRSCNGISTNINKILSYKIPCDMSYMSNMEQWSLIHPTAWGRCRKAKNRKLFFQLSGIRSENCCRSQPLERQFPISIVFFGKGRWEVCNKTVTRGWIDMTQQDQHACRTGVFITFIRWVCCCTQHVRLVYIKHRVREHFVLSES